MDIKTIIHRYRILIAAMLISLCWHMFWLSAVKIVTVPASGQPVKFSKVSFLGPILERGAIELGLKAQDRSFLEKRYPMIMDEMLNRPVNVAGPGLEYGMPDKVLFPGDDRMENLAGEAVGGIKLEPTHDAE